MTPFKFALISICRNRYSTFAEFITAQHFIPADYIKNTFVKKALGDYEISPILNELGVVDLDQLTRKSIPSLADQELGSDPLFQSKLKMLQFSNGISEDFFLTKIIPQLLKLNKHPNEYSLFLGQGFYGSILPPVIKRNVLENPEWYTSYTPYQAEISQGRLEVLFLYQKLIAELTGMDIANASLLDEPSALMEAINMAIALKKRNKIWVSKTLFSQSLAAIKNKTISSGVEIIIGTCEGSNFRPPIDEAFSCVILQSPDILGNTSSDLVEVKKTCETVGSLLVVATDLMYLVINDPPDVADIVIGSSQRFGLPLGYGGPGAGFISCKMKYARLLPGRIVGQSIDLEGRKAYRLSLQTREQHIRKEKATSNICTSQVLPAIISTLYAIYHGETGLVSIASKINFLTKKLKNWLQENHFNVITRHPFDTIALEMDDAISVSKSAAKFGIALAHCRVNILLITISEISTIYDILSLCCFLSSECRKKTLLPEDKSRLIEYFQDQFINSNMSKRRLFIQMDEFHTLQSEQAFTRYIFSLSKRDVSLVNSMIPLGSCTMKLNSASVMTPFSEPQWNSLHPLVPRSWAAAYSFIIEDLKSLLCLMTGFSAVTFQPASGAQAELTALLMIKKYHNSKIRDFCLIPESAHGTNFASSSLAGFKIMKIKCHPTLGIIDLKSFDELVEKNHDKIACLMITLPSTFGIDEPNLKYIIDKVHLSGGVVYLDGANLNSFLGICRPAQMGIDLMHINMHKTLSIPHGGGGPGMGPLLVTSRFEPFLPSHPFEMTESNENPINAVSGSPFSSASLLIIPWLYMRMLGYFGIRKSSQHAIANANYLAKKLELNGYQIVYKNQHNFVAHEFVCRPKINDINITPVDIAKRLQDYGYHAPTVAWPLSDALLIEPTESENIKSLHDFIQAMKEIAKEIEQGQLELLKGAPHRGFIRRINEEFGDNQLNAACCKNVPP